MRLTVDPAAIPPAVLDICRKLAARGHGAWIVGGCVRDHLLGRAVADWDICTTAKPEELLRAFPRAVPTGIEHGTVTVVIDHVHYEVTTLRGETTYSDGRRPDAVFFVEDVTRDLERRDFTINAIAYDPLRDVQVDPFGGRADLLARVIRAVGDPVRRFGEDGLRVLRAARLAATLEFVVDPETERAIETAIPVYRKVSAERVRDEWLKAMKARRPSVAFEVMRRRGILAVTCPELVACVACPQNHHHAHDVWTHTMHVLDHAPKDPVLRMAALLHDIGKPPTRAVDPATGDATFHQHELRGAEMAEDWLKAWRFSNEERERITHLVRNHLVAYDETWTDAAVRRFVKRVGIAAVPSLFALCRADVEGRGRDVEGGLAMLAALTARIDAVMAKGSALGVRDLKVDGNELMRELGLRPSRALGELLNALLERVIEDPDQNEREKLLGLARELHEKRQ